MTQKRSKQKVPEKSSSQKTNHYKGETKAMNKRLTNLEKRMQVLEKTITKFKELAPQEVVDKVAECINSEGKKSKDEFLKDFMENSYPKGKK